MKKVLLLLSFLFYTGLGLKVQDVFQAPVNDGRTELNCNFSMVYYQSDSCPADGSNPCMIYRRRSAINCTGMTQKKTSIKKARVTSNTGVIYDLSFNVLRNGKGKILWAVCDYCTGETDFCINCCVGPDNNTLYEDGQVLTLPSGVNVTCCKGSWVEPVDIYHTTVKTVITIEENGETFEQENAFNNATGVLELKVPQHGNLSKTTMVLEEGSNTNLLQTNNSCQLSSLPDNFNLTEMHSGLGNIGTANNETSLEYYIIKARESRVGVKEREGLLNQVQSHCSDQPIVKTTDIRVLKDDFDSGNLILVDDEQNSKQRTCIKSAKICSLVGPNACGYGWSNPDPDSPVKGFTFHQVSGGAICVVCTIQKDIPGTPGCDVPGFDQFCLCKDIVNKEMLMDCRFNRETQIPVLFDFEIWTNTTPVPFDRDTLSGHVNYSQIITYNKQYDRRAVIVDSPEHGEFAETKVIMNARSDGYWHAGGLTNNRMLKIDNKCHVDTLPANHFPIDMAVGWQEIAAADKPITPEDELTEYSMLTNEGPISSSSLHELVREEACKNSTIFQSKEELLTKEESDILKNGGVLFRNSPQSGIGSCPLLTAHTMMSRGVWRRPNDATDVRISVKRIVSSVASLTCYDDSNTNDILCPADFCLCSDIIHTTSFLDCLANPGQDDVIFVATGVTESGISGNMTILDASGKILFSADQSFTHLPQTTNSVGAIFRGTTTSEATIFLCAGFIEGSNDPSRCYMYNKGEGFSPVFALESNFNNGPGGSVVFTTDEGDYWWIIGESGAGTNTSVYFNLTLNYNLPYTDENIPPKLPTELNIPCITKINNTIAFVTGSPLTEHSDTNRAWLYDFIDNQWTPLPDTKKKRVWASCGVLETDDGPIIVLAGGLGESTTEIFYINNFTWEMEQKNMQEDNFASKMVNIDNELILIGGYEVEDNLQAFKPININNTFTGLDMTDLGSIPEIYSEVALTVPRKLVRDLLPRPLPCGPPECGIYCSSIQQCQQTDCDLYPCCASWFCVG